MSYILRDRDDADPGAFQLPAIMLEQIMIAEKSRKAVNADLTAVIMLVLAVAALKAAQYLLILAIDGLATAIAVWYCWGSARLTRALLAVPAPCNAIASTPVWNGGRRHRRLMARHLQLSIAMTAHFSLFPRSSARGYAFMRRHSHVVA